MFSDIVRSTVWREPDHVRIVWITMLAVSDKGGLVESSLPGLADMARVPIKECQEALKVLSEPDEWSRSKEFEGRRIREVEGGWLILNYEKYRNRLSLEDRRDYQRVKQAEYRAKKRGKGSPSASERLLESAKTAEEFARAEELASGVAPGSLGSFGPEAQEVVNRANGQGPQEESRSLSERNSGGGVNGPVETTPAIEGGGGDDMPDPDAA